MNLGVRQIECLGRFQTPSRFEPTRDGEPWSVMKTLIKRGLMWAKVQKHRSWHPDLGWWYDDKHWVAGLTVDGDKALAEASVNHDDTCRSCCGAGEFDNGDEDPAKALTQCGHCGGTGTEPSDKRFPPFPPDCHDRDSCHRHQECMYAGCSGSSGKYGPRRDGEMSRDRTREADALAAAFRHYGENPAAVAQDKAIFSNNCILVAEFLEGLLEPSLSDGEKDE